METHLKLKALMEEYVPRKITSKMRKGKALEQERH